MGKAIIKAADSAGLHIVPVSFGAEKESGQTVEMCGKEILVHGPSERESILASVFQEYPNLVVVDFTVPATVNGNLFRNIHINLYCISYLMNKESKLKPSEKILIVQGIMSLKAEATLWW